MSPLALLIADSLRKCVTFGSSYKWDATHCVGDGSDHILSMHHSEAEPPGWYTESSWAKETSSGLVKMPTMTKKQGIEPWSKRKREIRRMSAHQSSFQSLL